MVLPRRADRDARVQAAHRKIDERGLNYFEVTSVEGRKRAFKIRAESRDELARRIQGTPSGCRRPDGSYVFEATPCQRLRVAGWGRTVAGDARDQDIWPIWQF